MPYYHVALLNFLVVLTVISMACLTKPWLLIVSTRTVEETVKHYWSNNDTHCSNCKIKWLNIGLMNDANILSISRIIDLIIIKELSFVCISLLLPVAGNSNGAPHLEHNSSSRPRQ